MAKFYVYRVVNHNGRKEYKRTKCTDHWIGNKSKCWQFSELGAKNIAKTYNENCRTKYYTYGIEVVSD